VLQAPERRAQAEVLREVGREVAQPRDAAAVDRDVALREVRIGDAVGVDGRSADSRRKPGESARRSAESRRSDTSPAAAQQIATRCQSKTSASPSRSDLRAGSVHSIIRSR